MDSNIHYEEENSNTVINTDFDFYYSERTMAVNRLLLPNTQNYTQQRCSGPPIN